MWVIEFLLSRSVSVVGKIGLGIDDANGCQGSLITKYSDIMYRYTYIILIPVTQEKQQNLLFPKMCGVSMISARTQNTPPNYTHT